jgi:hypothetical protein
MGATFVTHCSKWKQFDFWTHRYNNCNYWNTLLQKFQSSSLLSILFEQRELRLLLVQLPQVTWSWIPLLPFVLLLHLLYSIRDRVIDPHISSELLPCTQIIADVIARDVTWRTVLEHLCTPKAYISPIVSLVNNKTFNGAVNSSDYITLNFVRNYLEATAYRFKVTRSSYLSELKKTTRTSVPLDDVWA